MRKVIVVLGIAVLLLAALMPFSPAIVVCIAFAGLVAATPVVAHRPAPIRTPSPTLRVIRATRHLPRAALIA